jgi:acyl homoserine lactone synthase
LLQSACNKKVMQMLNTPQFPVRTAQYSSMSTQDLEAMFRLRYDTFVNRLGWDVQVHNGMEFDEFDKPDTHYIYVRAPDGMVDACWRLLPTLGPNMLRDTFPQTLGGLAAPAATDVWELSRFAVATNKVGTSAQEFGPLSLQLMAESVRFGLDAGISRYVTVTTAAIERLLRRQGLHVYRLASPVRIGAVMTVACVIELDEQTQQAVGFDPATLLGNSSHKVVH